MTAPAPRRILHLVDRVTGGVPVAVRTYVAHSPAGVEHVIAAPFVNGAPAAVWGDTRATLVDWDTRSPMRAARELRRLVRAGAFDLVHAHSSFPGVYARVLCGARRGNLVYTPHCYAFVRTDIAPPVRAAFRLVEQVLAGRAVVAACGPGEWAEAARLGVPAHRLFVVPNVASLPDAGVSLPDAGASPQPGGGLGGLAAAEEPSGGAESPRGGSGGRGGDGPGVDSSSVESPRGGTAGPHDGADPRRRGDEAVRVGMLGRGAPQKDPAFFVARVAELQAALETPVEAWWIGDAEIEHSAVRITGWLSPAEVGVRLRSLDLYLHTAAWEGFPIALLDAHAAGLPLLARAIPALPALPAELTIEGGLPGFMDAVRAGERDAWSAANRAAWSAYLGPRTAEAQRTALARVWRVPPER